MQAISGFVVVDRAGEFIAWAAHAEVAKSRMDDKDSPGWRVERCSDGEVMAYRSAKKKADRYEESVPA